MSDNAGAAFQVSEEVLDTSMDTIEVEDLKGLFVLSDEAALDMKMRIKSFIHKQSNKK